MPRKGRSGRPLSAEPEADRKLWQQPARLEKQLFFGTGKGFMFVSGLKLIGQLQTVMKLRAGRLFYGISGHSA